MPATTASQAASAVHAPADMSVRSRNQSTHRCIPRSTLGYSSRQTLANRVAGRRSLMGKQRQEGIGNVVALPTVAKNCRYARMPWRSSLQLLLREKRHPSATTASGEWACSGLQHASEEAAPKPSSELTHCRRCGGQQSTTEPTGTRTGAHPTNNVPGAPKKTDSKDAPTMPINIPPIFNKQGLDIDTVRASVESEIRDACGNGELCVAVAVSQGDNDTFTQCQYAESRDSTWPRSPNDNAFRNAVDVLAKYEQLLE